MTQTFENKIPNPYTPVVFDVNAQEVLNKKSDLILIDVREISEYNGELGHVAGTELIPLATLPQNLKNIPTDKTIVFICRSGGRSTQACLYAIEHGIKNVYNMHGCMLMCNQLMLPVER